MKRPNQQYQSTEGKSTKYKSNNGNNTKHTYRHTIIDTKRIYTKNTASPLVYTNMG